MSSTSVRAEIAVRSALRAIGEAAGTGRNAVWLVGAAGAFQLGAAVWSALGGTDWQLVGLRCSWAFGLLAIVMLADAAAMAWRLIGEAVLRAAGAASTPEDPWQPRLLRGGLYALAYALLALALVASWRSHDLTRVRLAVGEAYGDPEQVVGFAARAGVSPEPPRVELGVVEVDATRRPDGTRAAQSAAISVAGAAPVTVRPWRPLWLSPAVLVFPGEAGIAPRFELRDGSGGLLESAFAKLDVLPPGKTDVLTFERAPHRVFLRLAPGDGSVDVWVAEAYRAKLPVATRRLGPGEQLEFDGLRFGIVGETPTATLAFVHDAGIPLAVAAALAAGLGVLASRWRGDRSVLPAGEGARDDRA